jgi:4'-phosphopantetheinyl transferase
MDPVRVWLIPVDVPPETVAACWATLDAGERVRADELESPRKRQRFAIAHGALRILAGQAIGTPPEELRWIPGRHGKPEVAQPFSTLHTSLSHSGEMIAVAISTDRPVGVDVQQLVPSLDIGALSARFFGPDEAAYVAAGGDARERADRFAHLWARKEATVKAVGGRLWPNLGIVVHGREVVDCAEPVSSLHVADIPAPPNYRAAVAVCVDTPFAVTSSFWPNDITASSPPSRSPYAADRG